MLTPGSDVDILQMLGALSLRKSVYICIYYIVIDFHLNECSVRNLLNLCRDSIPLFWGTQSIFASPPGQSFPNWICGPLRLSIHTCTYMYMNYKGSNVGVHVRWLIWGCHPHMHWSIGAPEYPHATSSPSGLGVVWLGSWKTKICLIRGEVGYFFF